MQEGGKEGGCWMEEAEREEGWGWGGGGETNLECSLQLAAPYI